MNALGALSIPALALCLAFATGCPDKKPKYPTCEGDKDCKEGEHCVDKKCVQCGDDSHCEASETCENNACVPREGWCESDADCPDFKVCQDNRCVPCAGPEDCPGGECRDGKCIRPGQCLENTDCADDEDCIDGKCVYQGLGGPPPDDVSCTLPTIYFDFDASTVRDDQRNLLDDAAECIKNEEQKGVYIVGHTDPRGTEEYNIALSDGRARAVADFLARLGIDPARFRIVPKGETEAQGFDESTWPQDRKVELEWQ